MRGNNPHLPHTRDLINETDTYLKNLNRSECDTDELTDRVSH